MRKKSERGFGWTGVCVVSVIRVIRRFECVGVNRRAAPSRAFRWGWAAAHLVNGALGGLWVPPRSAVLPRARGGGGQGGRAKGRRPTAFAFEGKGNGTAAPDGGAAGGWERGGGMVAAG